MEFELNLELCHCLTTAIGHHFSPQSASPGLDLTLQMEQASQSDNPSAATPQIFSALSPSVP